MTLNVLDKILVERPTNNIFDELRTPVCAVVDGIQHLLINANTLLSDAEENLKVDLSFVLLKGRELRVMVEREESSE